MEDRDWGSNPPYRHVPFFEDQVRPATDEQLVEELLKRTSAWDRTPRNHTAETPRRFAAMLRELTEPTDYDGRFTTFPNEEGVDEIIVLAPLPFYTLCAHHIIPFFGTAYVGYIPDGKIAGLSKFSRAIKGICKGFHVQETLTSRIADYFYGKLDPVGLAVVMDAEHLCMAMRGVETPGVVTTTSAMRGVFAQHDRTAKSEFMQLIAPRRLRHE
jgi:GTP cyclohydrolase IA